MCIGGNCTHLTSFCCRNCFCVCLPILGCFSDFVLIRFVELKSCFLLLDLQFKVESFLMLPQAGKLAKEPGIKRCSSEITDKVSLVPKPFQVSAECESEIFLEAV